MRLFYGYIKPKRGNETKQKKELSWLDGKFPRRDELREGRKPGGDFV